MKNSRPSVAIIITVLGIIVLAVSAFFLLQTQAPPNPMTQNPISTSTAEVSSSTAATSTTTPALSQSAAVLSVRDIVPAGSSSTASDAEPPQTVPSGYQPYTNPQFHFALDYPSNLKLHTYNEQGGGFTAVFQDPSTNEGFEVYVTPYSGTQITNEEFKLDEPSGVMQDPTNILVDGAQAIMFYGYNPVMGDTREVWFIHGGLLYEVTTSKLDTEDNKIGIMQTWRFV